MEVALATARTHEILNKHDLSGVCESESYLRQIRKWSGNPSSLKKRMTCNIVSVPDVRIVDAAYSINIEVESTIKSFAAYQRYLDICEEDVIVFWIIKDRSALNRLIEILEKTGHGRAKRQHIFELKRLEKALVSVINDYVPQAETQGSLKTNAAV